MTSYAAFPTAIIAHEEKRKTTIEPNSPPTNTGGYEMSIPPNAGQ